MHFSTCIFQQSWKKPCFHALPARKYRQGSWQRCQDSVSGHTQLFPPITLTSGHAAVPQPKYSPWGGMCSSPWLGMLSSAAGAGVLVVWEQHVWVCSGGAAAGLQGGNGLKMAKIVLVAAHPWLEALFFFSTRGASGGWKWKCRIPGVTSVCTAWMNTCLNTRWANAGSHCWLQFALVSA